MFGCRPKKKLLRKWFLIDLQCWYTIRLISLKLVETILRYANFEIDPPTRGRVERKDVLHSKNQFLLRSKNQFLFCHAYATEYYMTLYNTECVSIAIGKSMNVQLMSSSRSFWNVSFWHLFSP